MFSTHVQGETGYNNEMPWAASTASVDIGDDLFDPPLGSVFAQWQEHILHF